MDFRFSFLRIFFFLSCLVFAFGSDLALEGMRLLGLGSGMAWRFILEGGAATYSDMGFAAGTSVPHPNRTE